MKILNIILCVMLPVINICNNNIYSENINTQEACKYKEDNKSIEEVLGDGVKINTNGKVKISEKEYEDDFTVYCTPKENINCNIAINFWNGEENNKAILEVSDGRFSICGNTNKSKKYQVIYSPNYGIIKYKDKYYLGYYSHGKETELCTLEVIDESNKFYKIGTVPNKILNDKKSKWSI